MASITSSIVAPYSNFLVQDANYIATASVPLTNTSASTPSLFFPNIGVPEVGRFAINVFNTAFTNSSGSLSVTMSLEDSADNVTFKPIAVFNPVLLAATDGGALSAPAGNVSVHLPPGQVRQYVRARAAVPTGGYASGGITGSFGVQALF